MTPIKVLAAASAAIAFTLGAAALAATPPKADVASFAELQAPLPYPYDPQGDANPTAVDSKVARARAQALREHKLLLIDMGGNWCGDCRILAGTMNLPSIKRFVDAHYVEVTVDAGRRMDRRWWASPASSSSTPGRTSYWTQVTRLRSPTPAT